MPLSKPGYYWAKLRGTDTCWVIIEYADGCIHRDAHEPELPEAYEFHPFIGRIKTPEEKYST